MSLFNLDVERLNQIEKIVDFQGVVWYTCFVGRERKRRLGRARKQERTLYEKHIGRQRQHESLMPLTFRP